MKLRNLLFATMFACAFASCSSDDDPTIDPTPAEAADAYLDITVNTKTVGTKADVDTKGDYAREGESNINNLTIAVFNADNNDALIGYQRVESNGFTKKGDGASATYKFNSPVKTKAVKVKVYVLANVPVNNAIATAKDLSGYEAAVSLLSDQSITSLTMSSALLVSDGALKDAKVAPEGNPNKMGEGASVENAVTGCTGDILLQRVAARVQMGQVFSSKYTKAEKLVITGVYMFNVRSDAKLLGAGTLDYKIGTQLFQASASFEGDLKVKDESLTEGNALLKVEYQKGITINASTGVNNKQTLTDAVFYTMPNALLSKDTKGNSAYTLISVKGTYTSPEGITMTGDRWYTVLVGKEGAGNEGGEVVRNTVYDIQTLDITGSGSDNPYTPQAAAYLNAQVKVAPWSYVVQTPSVD